MTTRVERAQGPGFRVPPTVREGGRLEVDVQSEATHITLVVPGVGRVKIRVVDGVAEYRLPPTVHGGAIIFVSDMRLPDPAATTVLFVGNQ